MVTTRLQLTSNATRDSTKQTGKGLSRAHPRLASNAKFCRQLEMSITEEVQTFASNSGISNVTKWERIKLVAKKVAQRFSRKQAYSLKTAEKLLQRKRDSIIRTNRNHPEWIQNTTPQLLVIESQSQQLQLYHTETLVIRAGLKWRELGEVSAGYLKRTIAQKASRKLIPPLINPTTSEISLTKQDILGVASTFYSKL